MVDRRLAGTGQAAARCSPPPQLFPWQERGRSIFRRASRIAPNAPPWWSYGLARWKSAARAMSGTARLAATVRLRLVEVRESEPPEGVEPLHWRLLTTHEIADAAAAWQIVAWYQARWTIEQLFRVMKSQGLQLEDSQLASGRPLGQAGRRGDQSGLYRHAAGAGT